VLLKLVKDIFIEILNPNTFILNSVKLYPESKGILSTKYHMSFDYLVLFYIECIFNFFSQG